MQHVLPIIGRGASPTKSGSVQSTQIVGEVEGFYIRDHNDGLGWIPLNRVVELLGIRPAPARASATSHVGVDWEDWNVVWSLRIS